MENNNTSQKTYWHLLGQKRMPTDYELLTSKLLYYLDNGFETDVPVKEWFAQYQSGSPFKCSNWELFSDPRQTTYASYTQIQSAKETHVDQLLQAMEKDQYVQSLDKLWLDKLSYCLAPFLFPAHALQMVIAYIGQIAPAGKITVACAMQATDEVRRIQRIAYRIGQLRQIESNFADNRQEIWQKEPMWQPLRQTVESLLVTYDWGESFVALNLVIKPLLDELFMVQFGLLAQNQGDYLLQLVLASLNEDCLWHRQWCSALINTAMADTAGNKDIIETWISKWQVPAEHSIHSLAGAMAGSGAKTLTAAVLESHQAFLESLGLSAGKSHYSARDINQVI